MLTKFILGLLSIYISIVIFSCKEEPQKPFCSIPPQTNHDNYLDKLELPSYFDYELAQQCSKETGRHIFIMFYSWNNIACPGMYFEIYKDSELKSFIKNNCIFTLLYCDDSHVLSDTTKISFYGEKIKTIGEKNENFLITHFKTNSIPTYVLLDSNFKILIPPFRYSRKKNFTNLLDKIKLEHN